MEKDLQGIAMLTEYSKPDWHGPCNPLYSLDVIKEGTIIETLKFEGKSFFLVGKQDVICDIVMQHPSISRKHAVF